ncbi:MAG: glutamine--tRNA ligase/YqeY domain fusion protein [Deltaproteobacteria bacterium]|nr:glutamine--tRNA ligase/YqeY domain fusion protein [Deltaproteobacteria bacterium]
MSDSKTERPDSASAPRGAAAGESRQDSGPANFVRERIASDLAAGLNDGRVATRFPPEPNGYLHIGHAKSICLNFGMADEFAGTCNLRFDDTNPEAEDTEYVDAIREDVRWLGFDWQEREFFASDYFERLYQFAIELIKAGKAYVCSLPADKVREYRGNFYQPGKDSPDRGRSIEENLELFARMRAGEFADGQYTLRAKIDMQSANLNLRDPPIYRIKRVDHHRTGNAWPIYPMYDFAHGLSDALEGITHSICTLEFEDHRPLYDWFLDNLEVPARPQQIEFARLNLTYTVMSKRKLAQLVRERLVDGWNDPRMPTLCGMRRRGYTPEAIRAFVERIGVAKRDGVVDVSLLEHAVREDLNARCPRLMGVLRPLKLTIENFPAGRSEMIEAPLFPDEPERGNRTLRLTRTVYVERDDFREEAPRKWFRLAPGKEVRLRYACLVTCTDVVRDADGNVVELLCRWDPESLGGKSPDGRKVKGTLHWVSADHAIDAEIRLYDRLFNVENPAAEGHDFHEFINPDALEVITDAKLEPRLGEMSPGEHVQFERLGYFCADQPHEGMTVFNRTIGLRDSWAKLEKKLKADS